MTFCILPTTLFILAVFVFRPRYYDRYDYQFDKLNWHMHHMERTIMSELQDVLDAISDDIAAAAEQNEKAHAEILREIELLKGQIESGEEPDFTGVDAALARLKAISQALDDIVPDAEVDNSLPSDPDASVDNSLPGDPDAGVDNSLPGDPDASVDNSLPVEDGPVDPGYGVEEGATPDQSLPGEPNQDLPKRWRR